MQLVPVAPSELPAIADLVNSAYRGEASRQGWTTEADYLGGQRTDAATLARDLAERPGAALLALRSAPGEPAVGCVWLEPATERAFYLGMLTVRPDLQAEGLGRRMLEAAEAFAKGKGAARVRMTVVSVRTELVAWYLRRGYAPTGETRPFPYDDPLFGAPTRPDLEFIVLEKALASPMGGRRA